MMNGRPDARFDALALALARGSSLRRAARECRVAESTARRWAADETFKHQIIQIRQQVISQAVGRLAALATKAAATLGRLLDSADEETRLRAARAILADLVAVQAQAPQPGAGAPRERPRLDVPGLDARWQEGAHANGDGDGDGA
jgi:hypothetical protein